MACRICLTQCAVLHSHHTVPRSRGGDSSLQIDLCANCHNLLHAEAVHRTARIRNSKLKVRRFWRNPEDEHRAQPFLATLVAALVAPLPAGCKRLHLLSVSVPTPVLDQVRFLQNDLAIPSLEQTLAYCVNYTLSHKGIQNEKNTSTEGRLWFLQ